MEKNKAIRLGDKISNWLINIKWLNGFQGNPNDTRGGILHLEERILANDKQRHGAEALWWGICGFFLFWHILGLETNSFSIKDIGALFLGGLVAGIKGGVTELLQKLNPKRDSNIYDALITIPFGWLACLIIVIFKLIRLLILNYF